MPTKSVLTVALSREGRFGAPRHRGARFSSALGTTSVFARRDLPRHSTQSYFGGGITGNRKRIPSVIVNAGTELCVWPS
jgi:hypothetical protein